MLASLDRRERVPELMDDPNLDPAAHRAALAGLARANRLSRSADILWPTISRIGRANPAQPLRLLDVATGSGDVPIALALRARRLGIPLRIAACDISPTALTVAREEAAAAGVAIDFFVHDVLAEPLPGGFEIATSSLFLHHLAHADARTLLVRLRDAATRAVLVNDLERSTLGYLASWVGARILTRSPIVHFDGPASVRSAFTVAEAAALAKEAGLDGATVAPRNPWRFLLAWHRRR